jgi:hypothetical protein
VATETESDQVATETERYTESDQVVTEQQGESQRLTKWLQNQRVTKWLQSK